MAWHGAGGDFSPIAQTQANAAFQKPQGPQSAHCPLCCERAGGAIEKGAARERQRGKKFYAYM
jgi:hypothetical protein